MDSNSLMTPPEPGFFESWEAVQQHVQTHGTTQGYAVVTGKGTDKKNGKLNLIYDRSGQYENHGSVPKDQKLRKDPLANVAVSSRLWLGGGLRGNGN